MFQCFLLPPVFCELKDFGSSLVPMATAKDRPVMCALLSVTAMRQTRARREYRDARNLERKENAAMPRGHVRLDLVAIREFRNASTCLVTMVSHALLVMSVEVVSHVNQGFRSVDLR